MLWLGTPPSRLFNSSIKHGLPTSLLYQDAPERTESKQYRCTVFFNHSNLTGPTTLPLYPEDDVFIQPKKSLSLIRLLILAHHHILSQNQNISVFTIMVSCCPWNRKVPFETSRIDIRDFLFGIYNIDVDKRFISTRNIFSRKNYFPAQIPSWQSQHSIGPANRYVNCPADEITSQSCSKIDDWHG